MRYNGSRTHLEHVVKQLKFLSHPSAEVMSEFDRINAFVRYGFDAVVILEQLLKSENDP